MSPEEKAAVLRDDYIAAQFDRIDERFEKGTSRMQGIEDQMQAMRNELSRNSEITEDIRDLLKAGRLGLRVLGWIGLAAKWVGGLATAAGGLYTLWYFITHEGRLPPGR